jgi:Mce-associated membrane protein
LTPGNSQSSNSQSSNSQSGDPGQEQGNRSRGRLNIVLYVVALLCVALVGLLGARMWSAHEQDGGDRTGNWFHNTVSVLEDKRLDHTSARVGEDVGDGTVQALDLASENEQVRAADQIEAATKMVNAFLNIQYQNVEANIAAVRALATGAFLKQYNHAANGLVRLTRKAQATQTGEVVWAGLVSGDDDSATVIVATNGSVANKATDFKKLARTYRLQLDLELVDGQWLTNNFQYVN